MSRGCPKGAQRPRKTPVAVRFWSRVEVSGPDDCWRWTGHLRNGRYGHVRVNGERIGAHRLAWQLHHGRDVPPELFVLHRCDVPTCCNPAHLWIGSHQENMDDMARKDRAKHPVGEQHPGSKLAESTVRTIRSLRSLGRTLAEIASQFSINESTADRICRRLTWRHIA